MKIIKSGSKTNLAFGTGFIQRLQELSMYIADGKSTEEMDKFRASVTSNNVTEPWMYHLFTIVTLIKEIEQAAETQGHVEDVPDEGALPMPSAGEA